MREAGRAEPDTGSAPVDHMPAAFDQVHQIVLAKLNAANRIDWTRAAMDGSHIDAKKGAPEQALRRSTAVSPALSIT